jgi:hypothetical protein
MGKSPQFPQVVRWEGDGAFCITVGGVIGGVIGVVIGNALRAIVAEVRGWRNSLKIVLLGL